jgi:hypothetical protein
MLNISFLQIEKDTQFNKTKNTYVANPPVKDGNQIKKIK